MGHCTVIERNLLTHTRMNIKTLCQVKKLDMKDHMLHGPNRIKSPDKANLQKQWIPRAGKGSREGTKEVWLVLGKRAPGKLWGLRKC